MELTRPDGSKVTAASVPTGELIAAQRMSGAPNVVSASSEVPTGLAARVLFPVAGALMRIAPLRRFARLRLARVRLAARERPRDYSYGHAQIRWLNGVVREGWLRTGDAQAFTAVVAALVATRLARGEAAPGAYTPAAAFGPDLAVQAGGAFIMD